MPAPPSVYVGELLTIKIPAALIFHDDESGSMDIDLPLVIINNNHYHFYYDSYKPEMIRGMGMLVDRSNMGFDMRSWRYVFVADYGVIGKMYVEPEYSDHPCPGPFEVSDADRFSTVSWTSKHESRS